METYRLTELDRDYCQRMHAPVPRRIQLPPDFSFIANITREQHGHHHVESEREAHLQARAVARYISMRAAAVTARVEAVKLRLERMHRMQAARARRAQRITRLRWLGMGVILVLLAIGLATCTTRAQAQQVGGGVLFQVQDGSGTEVFHKAGGWVRMRCGANVTCATLDGNTFSIVATGGGTGGGPASWGSITGTLSTQTDLQTALNAKANSASIPSAANWPGAGPCTTNQFVTALANGTAPTCSLIDWTQIQNKPSFATVATSGAYSDLTGKPSIPAAQVNSDWSAGSGLAQILNKPTLGALAAKSAVDYATTDITNKPDLSGYALASALSGYVPTTRTINAKALTGNITLTAADVSALTSTTVLAATKAAAAGQPLLSYDATTGAFTQGALTAAQVGALASTTVLPATKTAASGQPLLSYDATTGAFTQAALTAANVGAETSGAVATHAAVTTSIHGIANTANLVLTSDSRLSDARTPLAHNQAETTITFTDITTGNATTLLHGFLPKLGGGTANFLRADGAWAAPAGSSGDVTDVNITTNAPLAGGATCASGVCAFTLDVNHDTATWNAYQLQGVVIDAAAPTTNDVLTYNGTQWTHTPPTGGGAPTTAQYWVGAVDATLSAEKDLSGWTGIVKNTAGTPTAAIAGDFPALNQNTSGTAANLSGTPALPNGTTATTQTAGDNSTKLATTAYVDGQTARNYEVAADWSTTGTTFSNITGLGWAIGASATQTFDCFLAVQDASTTVGMMLGFTGPASPTAVTVRADLLLTTQTAPTTQASTGAAWPTAIPSTACTSSCLASFKFWRVFGVIKNGTNAGTVQVQGKVASGTGKIGAASACWVH